MSVPVTDPILKAHERAHQMRSVERKLRKVAKRESVEGIPTEVPRKCC
jgi:hypothetical protein